MLKLLLKLVFIGFFCVCTLSYAENLSADEVMYFDKTKLIVQQIDLLKNRITQTAIEFKTLQQQDLAKLTVSQVNKQMLSQLESDIAVAKSNLTGIHIELMGCQQTASRLEKNIQEIQNQLNVFGMFGVKIARDTSSDLADLFQELNDQTALLQLEKTRMSDLIKLQKYTENILQLYKTKYTRIESLLKSQTVLLLKEQRAKTAQGFEQQQNIWFARLNTLKSQLNKNLDKKSYETLQNEIFYANENLNLNYVKIAIENYQDQVQQLKASLARGNSITLLNKASDQVQFLGKQLALFNVLLKDRLDILKKHESQVGQLAQEQFEALVNQYNAAIIELNQLNQSLFALRASLDQVLQQELSARQGLPGFGAKAWVDLGAELLLLPSLALQIFKSLGHVVAKSLMNLTIWGGISLLILEVLWITAFVFLGEFLKRIVVGIPDHEFGHINLKWLSIKLLHRNLIDIALIGNFIGLFLFLDVSLQNFTILINLALTWLVFKVIIMIARLCLIETVHDRAGHDVRLYHHLKWIFLTGGIVTALAVFMNQLPIVYEVKDLFDRLFLLFLLVASVFLLRQWRLIPGVILSHIDEQRTYLRSIIMLMGFLIPIVLLVNSLVGLFGYVNLILTMSWYESVFIVVLIGYLFLRGLLHDGMEWISKILIQHVTNGWLWTEAFLKPIDRVLRVVLFLSAWVILFLLYGWDRQSPVVDRLTKLLHYPLADVLSTTITPLSIMELFVVVSLLYWAARWTREFMYRILRTKDLGLRNSLAILSQYAMILIGIFISLRFLGIDFRALTVVATAFAFGVGLGLRDLVNNFACGFLLLIERPLRVGDVVSVNGWEGDVTHIGGRAVTVRTWDHMDVIVPNAEIFSKSFINWTARDNIIRAVINIKISRHDNPHYVQEVIYKVLGHNKDILKDPVPEVFLVELEDGLIGFEVRYHFNLRHVKSRIGMRSEVLMSIWDAFEKEGIKPPYPHHEVFLNDKMLKNCEA